MGAGGGRECRQRPGQEGGNWESLFTGHLNLAPWQLRAIAPARSSFLGGLSPWLPATPSPAGQQCLSGGPRVGHGQRPNRPDVPGDPPRSKANPGAFPWAPRRAPLGAVPRTSRGTVRLSSCAGRASFPAFSVAMSRGTTLETWAGGCYGARVCDPEVHRPQPDPAVGRAGPHGGRGLTVGGAPCQRPSEAARRRCRGAGQQLADAASPRTCSRTSGPWTMTNGVGRWLRCCRGRPAGACHLWGRGTHLLSGL